MPVIFEAAKLGNVISQPLSRECISALSGRWEWLASGMGESIVGTYTTLLGVGSIIA